MTENENKAFCLNLWKQISQNDLSPKLPFEEHLKRFKEAYSAWPASCGPAPIVCADEKTILSSNIAKLAKLKNLSSPFEVKKWAQINREEYWKTLTEILDISFQTKPTQYLKWDAEQLKSDMLSGASINIFDSCFKGEETRIAVVERNEEGVDRKFTVAELKKLSENVSHSLSALGIKAGQSVAIDMSFCIESVAIYLGIIRLGCAVVSIADSFAPQEIATRLRITNAKTIFTQDALVRSKKSLPLYSKVCESGVEKIIVLGNPTNLRKSDILWSDFLNLGENVSSKTYYSHPSQITNILFSSGTTGDPKAIPWTHVTPIKAAGDAWIHQNIKPGDVLCWPTNLGWMMGPWILYASLINQATLALYEGLAVGEGFAQFIADYKITCLGTVPSLVKTWRQNGAMERYDWTSIKVFSSTGECSNAEDMHYLSMLAGYKPIIEYCGGTEIGGAYITSTVIEDNVASCFTCPAYGMDFVLLDDHLHKTTNGEVYLIPPSFGLSETLLNRNHIDAYYKGAPVIDGQQLRKHGDQIEQIGENLYRALGRTDDTMNLGGIKVSSAEIERILLKNKGVKDVAAIAINPKGGGPSLLVIYLVSDGEEKSKSKNEWISALQQAIKTDLNPLFKISDLVICDSLPRTASNKIMRRTLRDQYHTVS